MQFFHLATLVALVTTASAADFAPIRPREVTTQHSCPSGQKFCELSGECIDVNKICLNVGGGGVVRSTGTTSLASSTGEPTLAPNPFTSMKSFTSFTASTFPTYTTHSTRAEGSSTTAASTATSSAETSSIVGSAASSSVGSGGSSGGTHLDTPYWLSMAVAGGVLLGLHGN